MEPPAESEPEIEQQPTAPIPEETIEPAAKEENAISHEPPDHNG